MCDGFDNLGADRAADECEQAYPTTQAGEQPRARDDLRPARAVIWLTLSCLIGWALVVALLASLPRAAAGIPATEPDQVHAGPDVLLIQHGPDGPIEHAGTVTVFLYLGATMLVEWVDTTTDPIFRSGFEAAP